MGWAAVAVERVEQLEESPLRPFVITRLTGAHLAVPVVAKTDLVHLLAVAVDVLLGRHGGMRTRLDGVLLGGQTVGIVAHRVEHIEAFQPFVSCINIRGDIAQWVTYVQARTRGIREHIQDIEFRLIVVNINLIDFVVAPILLPLFLDFVEVVIHIIEVFFAVFERSCKNTDF